MMQVAFAFARILLARAVANHVHTQRKQMRMRHAVLVMAGLAMVACHRSASDEPFLPQDWDHISSRLDPCLGTPPFFPVSDSAVEWSLTHPLGIIRLPSDFREVPVEKRGVRKWVGPDSSRFELTVSRAPSGGMASSGSVVMENQCSLPVAGHRAFTARLRMDDNTTARSIYAADATVVVRERVALNAWIESASALTRERLLRAFSELELAKAR